MRPLPAKTPHKTNTHRRPEAWHATVLKDEANNLLAAILVLTGRNGGTKQ